MKRIIVAFDNENFSESTMKYGLYLAKQEKAHLVGIFLGDPFCFSCHSYDSRSDPAGVQLATKLKTSDTLNAKAEILPERIFAAQCHSHSVKFTIHHDETLNLQNLINETVFADLLVISVHETLTRYSDELYSPFLKSLLKSSHCPVLLVPDFFVPIDRIVVLCNEDPESAFAIKMFSYLFPQMSEVKTQIISWKPATPLAEVPNENTVGDWVRWHFSNLWYETLPGDARGQLLEELKRNHKDSLIITGADQLSNLSIWLRPGIADDLIKELSNPIFIAHG